MNGSFLRSRLTQWMRTISGLLLLIGVWIIARPPQSISGSAEPAPELLPPPVEMEPPVVAIRGTDLLPNEEPLPDGAMVRIGSTRFRHPTAISREVSGFGSGFRTTSFECSREILQNAGRYRITTRYQTLTLTDAITGRRAAHEDARLEQDPEDLRSTASHDGSMVAVASTNPEPDATLIGRIWTVHPDETDILRQEVEIHVPKLPRASLVRCIFFSPDDRTLFVLFRDELLGFDSSNGRLVYHVKSSRPINDVAPAAMRYLSTEQNGDRLHIFLDGESMRLPQYRFRAPENGKLLRPPPEFGTTLWRDYTTSAKVTIGDIKTGVPIATLQMPCDPNHYDFEVKLAPDGRHVSHVFKGDLLVCEVQSGNPVLRVPKPEPKKENDDITFTETRFTRDGKLIRVKSSDGVVCYFDLKSGEEAAFVEGDMESPNQVDEHGVMRRIDPKTAAVLPLPSGYTRVVMDVSADAKMIAIGDKLGRIDVMGIDGRAIVSLQKQGAEILCVTFSPDGSQLAVSDRGRLLRVFSTRDWSETSRIQVPVDCDRLYPERLIFTPDGKRLLIQHDDVMAMWDLHGKDWIWDRSGMLLGYCSSRFATLIPKLLSTRNDTIQAVRPHNGQEWQTYHLPQRDEANPATIRELAISRDGRVIATIREPSALDLWDAELFGLRRAGYVDPKLVKSGYLNRLHFSPDGRRLAACDDHGNAHIFEVLTGELAFTLHYPHGAITDVRFGKDSRTLITSNLREVIVWDLTPKYLGPQRDLETLWQELGEFKAVKAEQARYQLMQHPGAIEFLKKKIPVAPAIGKREVTPLAKKLDDDHFRVRDEAEKELIRIGRETIPYLNAVRTELSADGARKLDTIVKLLESGPTGDERRQARSVEILELIGSREAWALIEAWSKGSPEALLTKEARFALQRK